MPFASILKNIIMANFSSYLPLLHNVEGGYQKLSNDRGNYNSLGQLVGTNWGIAAPTYERWIKRPPTELDMRSMKKDTAILIFKEWYWKPLKGDLFSNQSVANIVIDHGVNAGIVTAAKLLQEVLNNSFNQKLVVDGVIGNKSISAANTVDQSKLHLAYKNGRIEYYRSLGSSFYNAWLNRLKSFVYSKKKVS